MNLWHKFIQKYPSVYLFNQILRGLGSGAQTEKIQSVHDKYRLENASIALDIGCGPEPKNLFNCPKVLGLDIIENLQNDVTKCHLGFEALPFASNSVDYVTAYDVLEHIPKFGNSPDGRQAPFIFLMNEIHRVLKPDGIFASLTPVFPYLGAFQDPTHNNIMTHKTFELYFSDQKYPIASHYGIECNYSILYQKTHEQHLFAVLKKPF